MKYAISLDGPETTLQIHDEFRSSDRQEFDVVMTRLLADGPRQVTVDLRGLDYMDSVGLGLLLTLGDSLSSREATLTVSNPQGTVKDLLNLSMFDRLYAVNG